MLPISFTGLFVAAAAFGAERPTSPGAYLNQRDVSISYRTSADSVVDHADLWVSDDDGQTWQLTTPTHTKPDTLTFTASDDGHYAFFVVLWNDAGPSSPPPDPNTTPVARVTIDTRDPLLQIHEPQFNAAGDALFLQATLADENLGPEPARVFYRIDEEPWIDGGAATRTDDGLHWPRPDCDARFIDLKIVVTDRAGNRAIATLDNLELPAERPEPSPKTASDDVDADVPIITVTPPVVAPVKPVQPSSADRATMTTEPQPVTAAPASDELQNLRDLATQFLKQGRYSLAAARIDDALELSPDNAQLLVDSGSVLYRLKHYDQARSRFHSALTQLPEFTPALEGLALVAATQKRYPDAREHLLDLQRLLPQSASVWLRSGDIEHKLGNTRAAIAAWKRVLTAADGDDSTRDAARRRLDYFSPPPVVTAPTRAPAAADQTDQHNDQTRKHNPEPFDPRNRRR